MNILSKLLFALSFLLFASSNSELCAMDENEGFSSRVIYQYPDGVNIKKYEKPGKNFLGMTWTKHTYKRKLCDNPVLTEFLVLQ